MSIPDEKPARNKGGRKPLPEGAHKKRVTICVDPDVLAYFKSDRSRGYQTRINRALRSVMQAQSA